MECDVLLKFFQQVQQGQWVDEVCWESFALTAANFLDDEGAEIGVFLFEVLGDGQEFGGEDYWFGAGVPDGREDRSNPLGSFRRKFLSVAEESG